LASNYWSSCLNVPNDEIIGTHLGCCLLSPNLYHTTKMTQLILCHMIWKTR
jgi:hypothetical protein